MCGSRFRINKQALVCTAQSLKISVRILLLEARLVCHKKLAKNNQSPLVVLIGREEQEFSFSNAELPPNSPAFEHILPHITFKEQRGRDLCLDRH